MLSCGPADFCNDGDAARYSRASCLKASFLTLWVTTCWKQLNMRRWFDSTVSNEHYLHITSGVDHHGHSMVLYSTAFSSQAALTPILTNCSQTMCPCSVPKIILFRMPERLFVSETICWSTSRGSLANTLYHPHKSSVQQNSRSP